MFLKNIEFCQINNESATVVAENNCTRVVCAVGGELLFGNEIIARGGALMLPDSERATLVANGEAEYILFDVDGLECSFADVVSNLPCDRLELVAKLAFDADSADMPDSFFEGAALMLAAIINAQKGDERLGNKYVDMAKRYIDRNYASPIKVEDIAEEIGVDRKYLRNLFFKYLGVSTKDYLTALRIEKAKSLLDESLLSINEVSSAVGYTDALGFSKIFKKHVGVSPSEYRSGEAYTPKTKKEEKAEEAPREDIKYFLL